MLQLARKVAPIPLRSCWSNSRPTGQLHRTGRHTALLLRKQGLGHPLHRKMEEPCDEARPEPETEQLTSLLLLVYISLPNVSFQCVRLRASLDGFLALDVHPAETSYFFPAENSCSVTTSSHGSL